ncbi:MAG: hypothetical protein JW862_03095 [Anaerolineales bacterium]|nr:hypothetical protein [Anaerolineales bacterium]
MLDQTDKLMDQLAAPENLLNAWRIVRGNIPSHRRQRSAGPDGVTLAEFERDLPAQLSALRHMLIKGRYQPQPPGQFTIEKRSGGQRQIAVLNVTDRVAQRAAQQVIEPLYEPGFLPCSFGFRPGRSLHDAVYCARRLRGHGYGWVVDGDIASCFDSLDHQVLLQKIDKRIADARVKDLLHKWLDVGVLEHGLPAEKSDWLAQSWEKASHGLQRGFDWTLNNLNRQDRFDPYAEGRFTQPSYLDEEDEADSREGFDENDPYSVPYLVKGRRAVTQKQAVQQIATGGFLLGAGWIKQSITSAGPAALAALKSPAGRALLKRGLLIGGGALGAAAGLAVSGYFLYRQVALKPIGVLQGSPLSPLLANIYLHSFDCKLTRAGYRLVRFADDWVVLCPDQERAEKAYNEAVVALARIHLKVNPDKTHILRPGDTLEWLGETIS